MGSWHWTRRIAGAALIAGMTLGTSHAVPARLPLFQATTTGLIGYWKLDETTGTTAADSSSSAITGTYVGTPAVVTSTAQLPPPFGGISNTACLDFNNAASGQCINLGANLPLLNNVTGATLAYWVNARTIVVGTGLSIAVGGGTPPFGTSRSSLELAATNRIQGLARGADADPSKFRQTPDNAISLSTWVHVATTVDYPTGNIKVYVNGVEVTTGITDMGGPIVSPTAATNSTNAAIAASDGANGAFMDGLMDDVRVYSRVLTPAEIFALAAPAPPTGLTATGVLGGNDLQWTAGQPGTNTYAVYSSATGTPGSYALLQNNVTGTTFSDTGASTSAPTFYIVRSVVTGPIPESIDSNSASATATPIPPPPPRTQKVGDRHMCGCDTVSEVGSFALVAALTALALLLLARR